MIVVLGRLILSSFNNWERYITSLATYVRARSSTLVINVVIVSCLFARHAIKPLNSLIIYPYKLFQSRVLLVKEALLVT